jgi:predicted nucleic acid-binding protein
MDFPGSKRPLGNLKVLICLSASLRLGRLRKGITLLRESKKKSALKGWLEGLEKNYASSILLIDARAVHLWIDLTVTAQKQGKIIHACDGLIAATAKQHGLHLMTRNISDFEASGVMLINPWRDS